MKKNLVSVFIPSYNYARYLGAAIDSILTQSYTDWELIIIDDASTDNSAELIERYRRRYPDKIRSVLLKENIGQARTSTMGFGMALGEFLAPLAADDLARPNRLAEGVAYLRQQPRIAAAFSRVGYIDSDGRPLPSGAGIFNQEFDNLRWRLLAGNFLCATTPVIRLATLREVGILNPGLGFVEDYDLWLRLLDHHELVRVDGTWVDYRVHGENLSYAKNRQEQKFGPLYESVAVAVRAMQRWPLARLHAFQAKAGTPGYQKEAAAVQVRLAETCLALEQAFFAQMTDAGLPSPKQGVAAAYSFILDALQNDPANTRAQSLLVDIYGLLGDSKRAAGGKSCSLGEMATHGKLPAAAEAPTEEKSGTGQELSSYENWAKLFGLNQLEARQYERLASAGGLKARFHLATILPEGEENKLVATLKSIAAQSHASVLFTVVAGSDAPPGFAGERLRWIRADHEPLAAVNQSLIREDATWVGLIRCGDQIAEATLTIAAENIDRLPLLKAIYTDDDCVGVDGHIHSPRLKPEPDFTLLRSTNYAEGLVLTRWDAFVALGGFDASMHLAATYDLLLKQSERELPSAFGHLRGPLLHRLMPRLINPDAQARALAAHLERTRTVAAIGPGPVPESIRIDYALAATPLVSLIVPTRDRLSLLSRCIESILEKTTYAAYEIVIVDHGSSKEETRGYLRGLSSLNDPRFRVVQFSGAFSLAALFNAGASQAKGSYLLFLHDDVAVLHNNWIDKLLAHGLRPGIGAVGARLVTADGKLQHAGIVLGLSGVAELVGSGAALDDPGELGRYALEQEVAASSSACLLVRQNTFASLNGFDQTQYPIFLPEVDFCLRMAAAGWKTVWTPQATLLHDGPSRLAEAAKSAPLAPAERRQAWSQETEALLQRWLPQLARDPHYSSLYSLHPPAFRICDDSLLARDVLPWKPLPRILAQPADRHACGLYRVSAPLLALAKDGQVQGWDSMAFYSPLEIERYSPDSVVFQRPFTDLQLDFIERTARYSKSLRVFELDDLITSTPESNVNRQGFPHDLATRLKKAAAGCDRLVVSSEPLAQALKKWHSDIRVVNNYLPSERWLPHRGGRQEGGKPRVGWSGAYGHEGDLQMMQGIFTELRDEVHWVVFGDCPAGLRPLIHEIHELVPIAQYPAKLASLNLTLAIAPLEINAFNEAKSHLKVLEYGILGYPVICTDIAPYQGDYPVTRVRNQTRDWIKAIREMLTDLDECARQGDLLRSYVIENWLLENNLEAWKKAWLN